MNEGRKLGMKVERELKKKKKEKEIELCEKEFNQQFLVDILSGFVFRGGLQNFIGVCF